MFSVFVLTPPLLNFHFLFMDMLLVGVGEAEQSSPAVCTAFISSFLCRKETDVPCAFVLESESQLWVCAKS